jgi:hypothetical protein
VRFFTVFPHNQRVSFHVSDKKNCVQTIDSLKFVSINPES